MLKSFDTQISGKWILAGEHTVLRGGTAVGLPLPERTLHLKFEPADHTLKIEPQEAQAPISALLHSLQDLPEIRGTLSLESTIPQGAGLGSSAALCIALSRWLAEPLKLNPQDLAPFATRLENVFHGKSSGMDVATILADEPISFSMEGGPKRLGLRELPLFTFHDTETRSKTHDSIAKVTALRDSNPTLGSEIDNQMQDATRHIIEGLTLFDQGQEGPGHLLLAQGMNEAHQCFVQWGLVTPGIASQRAALIAQGALACKLTGAGGGGILVALW